jgi:hypothetical protein
MKNNLNQYSPNSLHLKPLKHLREPMWGVYPAEIVKEFK